MFKLYTEKDVCTLVTRLKEEYEGVLQRQKSASLAVKEENTRLRARLAACEEERGTISSAILHAEEEGERIRRESAAEAENERRELKLLAEQCRALCDKLLKKYPDEEDVKDFAAFNAELKKRLAGETGESGFDMDAVLSPGPLDLSRLCRELGLMEDET